MWIDHPALANPVNVRRWLIYRLSHVVNEIAEWLHELALEMEFRAIYEKPRSSMYDGDEIPF